MAYFPGVSDNTDVVEVLVDPTQKLGWALATRGFFPRYPNFYENA